MYLIRDTDEILMMADLTIFAIFITIASSETGLTCLANLKILAIFTDIILSTASAK